MDFGWLIPKRVLLKGCIAVSGAVLLTGASLANPLPKETVTIVVPLAAGGPTDAVARILAAKIQASIGQTVIVENKPGAGGNIGAAYVARSQADGLTWLVALDSTFTINPAMYKSLGFELADLSALAGFAESAQVLVANANIQAKSLKEFVAEAKANAMSYASAGVGTPGHLTFEYLSKVADIKVNHVPYKGNAPAVTDLIGRQVDAGFLVSSGVISLIKGGGLRGLAYSGSARLPALPDIPTVAEAGYPDFAASFKFMTMVPNNVPAETKTFIAGEVRKALESPDVKEKLTNLGLGTEVDNEADAEKWLVTERNRWSGIISTAGITAN
ncbi:Bug family tripartite tricarboxylate transporter substrate binding protein [Neorhizobium sp. DT-125]|uniref:Bug family tripartite tricarboxylate transporter substrate binding protein n=1 Tax=Neorhizobium sp. DT-125 TaxID=3396163 RepID=UPI003F1B6A3F